MNEASQCENPSVSVSVQQRVDDVCVRFEAACQAGQRPRIEDYVSDVPDVERSLLLRELLKIDIAYRRRAGENPCLQDYRDRFPSLDLAFLSSTATSEAGREQTNDFAHPAAPPGGATHIRCPHCHNPIPRIDDQPDEVLCPGCGSSFRVREARQTTTMAAMRPLGKFQLLERVGLGAFGAVWRARDTELDRMVALKMPHTSLLTSEADLERFHREARAAGQLRHPGIVTVHEVRMLEGVPTIVSDFIEGVPLKNLLEVRRLTFREAATLVADVAAAMDYAHTMGLVHRDIKPANIMIEYGHAKDERPRASAAKAESERGSLGRPLVMDFGLALRQEAEITLTLDGHIVGTPAYMSPEQAAGKGHEADRRSDVYSLGVILYELLCGELPFRGSKTMMLHQVVHEEPRPPRRVNDKIPRDLETICLKAMAKAPGRRYPSGRALAEDLRRFLSGQPIEARPVGAWERCVKWMKRRPAAAALVAVSGLAALALVGVAVGLWYNGQLQDALNMAKEQGLEADKLRARAEAQELSVRYARDMHLAHQAWQQDKIGLVLEQLNNWRSPQEGQPDLRGWEWDYLYGLCHKDLFTLQGHADEVHSVAFSPNGRWVASASHDRTVKLWDASTGELVRTLSGHTGFVKSVAFSPDGQWLASGSDDKTVKLWDAATGQELCTFRGDMDCVACVDFSRDGKKVACAGRDRMIRLWDLQSRKEIRRFTGHANGINSVSFSPDDRWLVSASYDGTVTLWDAVTGREVRRLRYRDKVYCAIFSPDGKWVASAGEDRAIKVWEAGTGNQVWNLEGHVHYVWCLAFSRDGRRLASVSDDATARLWDTASGQQILVLRGHLQGIRGAAVSPEGHRLASASLDGTVKLWDTTRGPQDFRTLHCHTTMPTVRAVFSPDGQWLAAAVRDGTARILEVASGQEVHNLRGHEHNEVRCVAFSPDGRQLASSGGDQTLRIWDTATGKANRILRGHTDQVLSVAFSPDGRQLASASEDQTLKLWDTSTGRETYTLRGHTSPVQCVVFSPDGQQLASAGHDKTIRLWDVASGQEARTLRGHTDPVLCVAFSPDGRQLASSSSDKTIRVWNARTGEAMRTFRGHTDNVWGVTFSPAHEGRRLASASWDRSVKLWDTTSGQELLTLQAYTAQFSTVAFSPDGRTLMAAGPSPTVTDGNPTHRLVFLWELLERKVGAP